MWKSAEVRIYHFRMHVNDVFLRAYCAKISLPGRWAARQENSWARNLSVFIFYLQGERSRIYHVPFDGALSILIVVATVRYSYHHRRLKRSTTQKSNAWGWYPLPAMWMGSLISWFKKYLSWPPLNSYILAILVSCLSNRSLTTVLFKWRAEMKIFLNDDNWCNLVLFLYYSGAR